MPIDPPRAPLIPVARLLAEAALQRQGQLLGADKAGALPAAPAAGLPLPTGAAPVPAPPPASQVSLSAQARQSLEAQGAGLAPGGGAAAGNARGALAGGAAGTAARLLPLPSAVLNAGAPAVSGAAAGAWPATGAGGMTPLLDALVRQLTAPTSGQRVVAAQPWTAAQAEAALAEADAPSLRTWLVGQALVQTPEGGRNAALALRVPAPWLLSQPGTQAAVAPAASLAGAFAGRPQALASGLFALVLQPEAGGARTSALLALEFAPFAAATVYGRDPLQVRNDPWLQMAALQASGQWREDEELAARRDDTPCATPGCPYAGRAPCEQPFCLALRAVQPPQATDPA